jgi:ABC-type branched-subunit amino acid transport system substrate-binding protein
LNESGGVGGKYKVELVVQDTKYEAPAAVQLYNGMKNDVVMFTQVFGTHVVSALLPQLKTDNIVAQPASLDSFWVREQQLLPVGGPYQVQAINAIDYWLNNGGKGKKACAIASNDPYGEAGLEGVRFAAKELGFTLGATPRFSVSDTDFTAQVNELKSSGCQMVFAVITATNLSGIIGSAVQLGFDAQWIGQAPAWLSLFTGTALKDYLVKNFWVASEGPAWGDTTQPGMVDLVAAREKYSPQQPPDQYYLYGWAAAAGVTEVLTAAVKRGDLSRQGIVDAMNSLPKLTFGGLVGDYGWGKPPDRNPPRTSTVFKVDPAKPYGLAIVIQDYKSKAAEAYKF